MGSYTFVSYQRQNWDIDYFREYQGYQLSPEVTKKVSVEELNELSIVDGNDGNPEPRCSISNIIITTVLVSLVSISYFTTSPEQC